MTTSTFVKVGLIIVIILLVGVLGTLTGYFPKVIPETTTTTSTTIVLTTTSTITPITVSTIIPKIPCSPCFSYFVYIDHSSSNLRLRNGDRAVTINNVNFDPNQDIELSINCPDISCNVEVTYKDTDTGIAHTDSATLHKLTNNIQLTDAYCQDNTIKILIKNIGNSPISSMSFYVNGVEKSEISGCLNNPLLPDKSILCQVVGISGNNQLRIIGPSNAVSGTVECTIKPVKYFSDSYNYENALSTCNSLCSNYENDCSDIKNAVVFCLNRVNIDINGNKITGEHNTYNVIENIPLCEDGIYCFHIKKDCICGSLKLSSDKCLQILCDYYQGVQGLSKEASMELIRNGVNYGTCELGTNNWWVNSGYDNLTC